MPTLLPGEAACSTIDLPAEQAEPASADARSLRGCGRFAKQSFFPLRSKGASVLICGGRRLLVFLSREAGAKKKKCYF